MAYVPNISNTLLNKLRHPTLVLQACVHAKNAAKLLLQGRGNQRKSVRKHERKLFPICAEKVQNMCKDHLTPCNAGKIPLGLARKDGTIQVPTDGNMWNFGGPQNVHPASSNYPTTCQSKPQETQISNGNVSCSCKVSLFTLRRDAPESYRTYARCV